jgi:hypothetical protein
LYDDGNKRQYTCTLQDAADRGNKNKTKSYRERELVVI